MDNGCRLLVRLVALDAALSLNHKKGGNFEILRRANWPVAIRNLVLLRFVLLRLQHLHATAFRSAPYFTKDIRRGETHPLLLIGTQSLVERLPCIGELFKAGASFRQGLSADPHDFDWIELMLTDLLGHLSEPFNSMVPRLGSGTDGVL
jgi:hypothetical protein